MSLNKGWVVFWQTSKALERLLTSLALGSKNILHGLRFWRCVSSAGKGKPEPCSLIFHYKGAWNSPYDFALVIWVEAISHARIDLLQVLVKFRRLRHFHLVDHCWVLNQVAQLLVQPVQTRALILGDSLPTTDARRHEILPENALDVIVRATNNDRNL